MCDEDMQSSVVDDALSVLTVLPHGYVEILLWVHACRGNARLVKVYETGSDGK